MGIQQFCTAVFLLDAGWRDWRRREISLTLTALFGAAGLLNSIIQGRDIKDFLIPAGIGLIFLALGILSGGALGAGDGLLLLALGLASDTGEYLGTLLGGMFLAAAWSGVLLVVFRKGRKTEIPFVPFLLFGYIGGLLL